LIGDMKSTNITNKAMATIPMPNPDPNKRPFTKLFIAPL
jgi:hypothetical protein